MIHRIRKSLLVTRHHGIVSVQQALFRELCKGGESWQGPFDSAMMEWHPSPHGGPVHAELISGYPLFSPATDQ
jgi:hypothetical protein